MNSLYKGCQKIKDSGLLKKKKISTAKKRKKNLSQAPVAHAYNPSYLGA
jgi:hypothetical protein